MASCLRVWTLVVILYQTIICVTISWLTLDCRLTPRDSELHEVTLMKFLYLHDPRACGRVHFYNFTYRGKHDSLHHNILWAVKNNVATSFRRKLQLWLSLHIIWLLLAVVNVTHGQRSCGLYTTLLPFTLTGVTLLVVDVIYAALFLEDVSVTRTEVEILKYVSKESKRLRWINKMIPLHDVLAEGENGHDDTTWIPLMFAYVSCRGVVQWIINFWIVKDNYYEGVAMYRRARKEKPLPRYGF